MADLRDWRSIAEEKEKYAAYLCSREWGVLRQAVHDRANGICERCRLNKIDAVHHLSYKRKYREQLEDLQGICNGCHEFTHGRSDKDPAARRRHPGYCVGTMTMDNAGCAVECDCGSQQISIKDIRSRSFEENRRYVEVVFECHRGCRFGVAFGEFREYGTNLPQTLIGNPDTGDQEGGDS